MRAIGLCLLLTGSLLVGHNVAGAAALEAQAANPNRGGTRAEASRMSNGFDAKLLDAVVRVGFFLLVCSPLYAGLCVFDTA